MANKSDAIDRALKVVRTRIEGLGVSETVIQKAGNDRIVVDIPGIDDRERAIKIAQDQAFLAVPDHRQDEGAREGAAASRRDRQGARLR